MYKNQYMLNKYTKTNKQTDKQTNRQTDRHTHSHIPLQTHPSTAYNQALVVPLWTNHSPSVSSVLQHSLYHK